MEKREKANNKKKASSDQEAFKENETPTDVHVARQEQHESEIRTSDAIKSSEMMSNMPSKQEEMIHHQSLSSENSFMPGGPRNQTQKKKPLHALCKSSENNDSSKGKSH